MVAQTTFYVLGVPLDLIVACGDLLKLDLVQVGQDEGPDIYIVTPERLACLPRNVEKRSIIVDESYGREESGPFTDYGSGLQCAPETLARAMAKVLGIDFEAVTRKEKPDPIAPMFSAW